MPYTCRLYAVGVTPTSRGEKLVAVVAYMPQSLAAWVGEKATREGLTTSAYLRSHHQRIRAAEELPTHGQKVTA
jgi:hypothetical protein